VTITVVVVATTIGVFEVVIITLLEGVATTTTGVA
jgi:hypothetical protein